MSRESRAGARDARNRIARIAALESTLETAIRKWEDEDWERLGVTGIDVARDEDAEFSVVVTVEVETEDCRSVNTQTGEVEPAPEPIAPVGEGGSAAVVPEPAAPAGGGVL